MYAGLTLFNTSLACSVASSCNQGESIRRRRGQSQLSQEEGYELTNEIEPPTLLTASL